MTRIRHFYLFSGSTYYPNGGLGDYQGTFPTWQAARARVSDLICDWWQIVAVNPETGNLVEFMSSH
jgi:hypothetical protein